MNNEQDPFNPAFPSEFILPSESTGTDQGTQVHRISSEPGANARKAGRKSTRAEKRATNPRNKQNRRINWPKLKEKLNAKLSGLDKDRLKAVLVACGISAAVVGAVILAVKFLPTLAVLLAAFGLVMILKIWDRLRRRPEPAY